jgi:hypothetical protein
MAKIVPLQPSISAPRALDLYGPLLTWPAREIVPANLAPLPGQARRDISAAAAGETTLLRSLAPTRPAILPAALIPTENRQDFRT